jgi:hypothetical protein
VTRSVKAVIQSVATALVIISIAPAITRAVAKTTAPPIRLSPTNQVPKCVTPSRLVAFLINQSRRGGHRLQRRFRIIAREYQRHGTQYNVRWDYAFFQMALETNFLSFRQSNGRPGDVRSQQNNFAGLGTTGGGVPGDSYPDITTGVLAQIQHLVVYSGTPLRNPVGKRTRLKQSVILSSVRNIARRRPVTFADLAGRWAADRRYGRSISRLAKLFFDGYCHSTSPARTANAEPRPARSSVTQNPTSTTRRNQRETARPSVPRPRQPNAPSARTAMVVPPPSRAQRKRQTKTSRLPLKKPRTALAKAATSCLVQQASYGGKRAVLIESSINGAVKLTALGVHLGFENAMAANFIEAYAPNGRTIGAYNSRNSALAQAHKICRRISSAR